MTQFSPDLFRNVHLIHTHSDEVEDFELPHIIQEGLYEAFDAYVHFEHVHILVLFAKSDDDDGNCGFGEINILRRSPREYDGCFTSSISESSSESSSSESQSFFLFAVLFTEALNLSFLSSSIFPNVDTFPVVCGGWVSTENEEEMRDTETLTTQRTIDQRP